MNITYALQSLRPKAKWSLDGSEYESLIWLDENQPKPTEEEIIQEIENLKAAEPMRRLRVYRDKLLAEVDWVTIRSYNQGVPVPEEWVQYCQALRDLPTTATPTLDPTSKIGISGVDWPVKPQ
jgi:hypothetical protein